MLKYEAIAQQLNDYIIHGQFNAGDKLPSVTTLKATYGVSKSTIVKALEVLEHDGVIYQAQGSGIYVRNTKDDNYINVFKSNGFSKSLSEHQITSKVLELKEVIHPPQSVINELKLAANEVVYYLKRLRYVDHDILCIEESYYSKQVVKYLNTEIVAGSIFNYLEHEMNIRVGFSDIYFNVDKLQYDEAQLLHLAVADPCLRYHQTFYTTTGIPFDSSDITFHYQHAHFFIPSKK